MAKNGQHRIDERRGFLLVLAVYVHNPLLFYQCNINLTPTKARIKITENPRFSAYRRFQPRPHPPAGDYSGTNFRKFVHRVDHTSRTFPKPDRDRDHSSVRA